MDEITRAVRAMYEAFPYPAGVPELRVSSNVRLLTSYGRLPPPAGRALTALDAGCGRGLDAMGLATLQPDVRFTAVDVNRVALDEAAREAARRKLTNLRFQEVDLMTLEGLEVPAGGFDVVFSSGVLHHLSDPAKGLALLRSVLAPHGVLVLMVYGRHGREPLYRMARALDALAPRALPLPERLAAGRQLAASGAGDALRAGPWGDLADVSDVEFVDRYLNVHETSYDLTSLWQLSADAGLRFLRWCSPADWDVARVLGPGALAARAQALAPLAQYQLVEQLCWRPRLELLLSHEANGPRAPLERQRVLETTLAVSPEVAFEVRTRSLHKAFRTEAVSYREGAGEPAALEAPLAVAALLLREQTEPFPGRALVTQLARQGMRAEAAVEVVMALLARGIVYAPHA